MRQLNVTSSSTINATADRVWEVLADDFLDIALWARDVNSSGDNHSSVSVPDGAPAGGRFCDVNGLGQVDERIVHFDSGSHEITWTANSDKLPGFVSGVQNALTIDKIDDNTSRVTSNLSADLSGFLGTIMAPMMRRNFSKLVAGFLEDLDVYAGTGQISKVKQRQLTDMN